MTDYMQTGRTILPDCGLIDVEKLRRTQLCSFESVESLVVVITHTAPKQLFLLLFLKSPIFSRMWRGFYCDQTPLRIMCNDLRPDIR